MEDSSDEDPVKLDHKMKKRAMKYMKKSIKLTNHICEQAKIVQQLKDEAGDDPHSQKQYKKAMNKLDKFKARKSEIEPADIDKIKEYIQDHKDDDAEMSELYEQLEKLKELIDSVEDEDEDDKPDDEDDEEKKFKPDAMPDHLDKFHKKMVKELKSGDVPDDGLVEIIKEVHQFGSLTINLAK